MSGLEKFFELSIMGELVRSTILFDKIQKSDSLANCSPLMIAIARNDCEMLSTLLDGGADVNESDGDGLTPLMAASVLGRKEIIGTLLSHGADVNVRTKDGHTAIMYASFFSDSDCVKLLIKGGADLRSRSLAQSTSGRTFPDALIFYIKEYTNHTGEHEDFRQKLCVEQNDVRKNHQEHKQRKKGKLSSEKKHCAAPRPRNETEP